jgi:acetyl-CoA carboxylase carboxyl transferase subunit alpha
MMENAVYSVITPEGCASILWRDARKNKEAAEALKMTAQDMQQLHIVDGIIPEPLGGAHMDFKNTANNIKSAILKNLEELKRIPVSELLDARIKKFREMGVYKN